VTPTKTVVYEVEIKEILFFHDNNNAS